MDLEHDRVMALIAWQLGRVPSIPYVIAADCRYGWPAVLKSAAFTTCGSPNPNLYYLSCPYLRTAISRLEDAGFTKALQERVAADRSLSEALALAQDAHSAEWAAEATRAAESDLPSGKPVYIAGSGRKGHLKCLHAHLAYYLTHRDYRIGKLIEEQIDGIWCRDERCGVWVRKAG